MGVSIGVCRHPRCSDIQCSSEAARSTPYPFGPGQPEQPHRSSGFIIHQGLSPTSRPHAHDHRPGLSCTPDASIPLLLGSPTWRVKDKDRDHVVPPGLPHIQLFPTLLSTRKCPPTCRHSCRRRARWLPKVLEQPYRTQDCPLLVRFLDMTSVFLCDALQLPALSGAHPQQQTHTSKTATLEL